MQINFPLYEVRHYMSIFEEGKFRVIQTNKNRYVLDYIDKTNTSYADRRLRLLSDRLPYNIYPLNRRIESINQMMLSKVKKFIDREGILVSWKPTTFYPVVCVPIKSTWITSKGLMGMELKGLPTKFVVTPSNCKYAQVVQVGRLNILFDLCDEIRPKTRKKI